MIRDPETARAHADLTATLQRMEERISALGPHRAFDGGTVTFRASGDMQAMISRYMRQHRIATQAEAIRRLVMLGLGAAG